MALLDFVFVPTEPLDLNYEPGLLNILESEADFAQEDIDIKEILIPNSTNLKHFFKNYLFDQDFSFNDTIDLLDWGLEVSGTLIYTLYDVTNFLSNDEKNKVDL